MLIEFPPLINDINHTINHFYTCRKQLNTSLWMIDALPGILNSNAIHHITRLHIIVLVIVHKILMTHLILMFLLYCVFICSVCTKSTKWWNSTPLCHLLSPFWSNGRHIRFITSPGTHLLLSKQRIVKDRIIFALKDVYFWKQ